MIQTLTLFSLYFVVAVSVVLGADEAFHFRGTPEDTQTVEDALVVANRFLDGVDNNRADEALKDVYIMDNSRPVSDYTLKQQQKLSNAWTGVQEAVGLKPEEFRQPAFDQWELERVEEAWNKMLAAMGRSTNFTAMFANIHKPPANLLAVGQHAIQRHYKQITSFGEVLNRKVIGVEVRKELPMYPDGKYVVVTYDYDFSKKNDFLLNVVVTLDAEQGAKVLTLQRRFVSKMRSDEDAGQ